MSHRSLRRPRSRPCSRRRADDPMSVTMRVVLCAVAAVLASQSALAQTPEEFYRGRTISLVIPNAPGGSFDLYARLAAAHLGRFIPGNPSIVAQNMPGAAGMQAANYLTTVAPKDGT